MTNPSAFPHSEPAKDGGAVYWHGMTLRDYFAAHALPAAVGNRPGGLWQWVRWLFGRQYKGCIPLAEETAKLAYKLADAMLAAREAK